MAMKNVVLRNRLDALLESTTPEEADNALRQVMLDVGYDHFSYNYYPKQLDSAKPLLHVLCAEQTQDWQAHYCAKKYEQIDPIHHHMRKSLIPVSWKLEDELPKYGDNQNHFFLDAMEFGLRGGFAIPIHSAGGQFANLVIQDVSILNQIRKHPEMECTLYLAAHYYHARISHFLENAALPNKPITLTTRELECLRLTAQHKSAKEIAQILHITPRTVGFHIENAIKKLHAINKYQAVQKATQYGLLS